MSNKENYNFPEFHNMEKILVEQLGFNKLLIANPASNPKDPANTKWEDFMKDSVIMLASSEQVVFLDGWEQSRGANIEFGLATVLGMPCFDQNLNPITDVIEVLNKLAENASPSKNTISSENVLVEADRITDGDRQNSYGPPDQDFTRTASIWSALFVDLLKDGKKFASENVAQAMIALKLSRLQHSKKRDSVVDIAGYAKCMDRCYQYGNGYQQ